MEIHVLPAGPLSTNAYLITCLERKEAILVDTPPGVTQAVKWILERDGLRLVAILLTHGHWDHMAEAEPLRCLTQALVYAHEGDALFYTTPGVMSASMPRGLHIQAPEIAHWVKQGESLSLMGMAFEVRHVPGHSPGNVLFYNKDLGAFVGDALFQKSIGRTDLPGGSFNTLQQSIREQIYTLPSETPVYPGHGEPTIVEEEAINNPYVRRL